MTMTKRTHLGTENQAAAVATAATRVAVRSATSRSVPNLCVFLSFLLFTTYSSSSSTSCSFVLASSTKADRKIFVRNNTGRRIALHWVHPTTNERSLMSQPYIANTAEFELGSYVSHQFEVEELPSDKTQRCRGEDSSCRTAQFAVSDNERQIIEVNEEFQLKFIDHKTLAREAAVQLIQECQANATATIMASTGATPDDAGLSKEDTDHDNISKTVQKQAFDTVAKCLSTSMKQELEKLDDEIAFQAQLRRTMAKSFENYTCADNELPMSRPIESTNWFDPRSGRNYPVHVLLDQPASRVHVLDNFVTDHDCKAFGEQTLTLVPAMVADGKGGFEHNPFRRAKQAIVDVDWKKEAQGDLVAAVSRKIYDYTQHVLGLDIDRFGQEKLVAIEYKGQELKKNGKNSTEPDQYKPHCDGDCTGEPHKVGTRVATVIMYCAVPTKGGATNFRNSGLHVVPEKGRAVFFSYIDPETRVMDDGYTEHSGCPVLEGEKTIVTQWLRLGVTEEVPYYRYDSKGNLIPLPEVDENGMPKNLDFISDAIKRMKDFDMLNDV